MKKLNEASIIKYNDTAFMIIGGITYYVPIAALDTMLPGSGTAITFASGTGKAGEEILKEMKIASKEGIKSEYEAGNISEETYNSYTQIWNMTDEEYMKNVNLAKINGKITEEEYEQMETIRNMADSWTTKENMNKAMGVSAASGAWEAAQWIVGKNLNGMNTIGGSRVAASFTRVGIDTAFNAADTPFRSLLASGALNKDFVETFNERGGWQGVGVNAGVGLVGSLFGEGKDWFGNKKEVNIEKNKPDVIEGERTTAYEDWNRPYEADDAATIQTVNEPIVLLPKDNVLPDVQTNYIKKLIDLDETEMSELCEFISKKIDLDSLDKNNSDTKLMGKLTAEWVNNRFAETGKIITTKTPIQEKAEWLGLNVLFERLTSKRDQFFRYNTMLGADGKKQSGVKQSMFGVENPIFRESKIIEISERYNIDERSAAMIIERTHSNDGNCSVATATSVMSDFAIHDTGNFYDATGIKPIIEQDGKKVINTEDLYLAAFINANTGDSGFISKKTNGNLLVDVESQAFNGGYGYMATGFQADKLNAFFEEKKLPYELKLNQKYEGFLFLDVEEGYSDAELTKMARSISEATLSDDRVVTLGINPSGERIKIIGTDGYIHECGGAHMVRILGVNATGMVCDTTWGCIGEIPWTEFSEKKPGYILDVYDKVIK